MAGPITWRTVMGQSLADASRPLEAAGRSFNYGFDKFQDVLKQREDIEAANAKQMVANRTNDALNQVYGIDSPEAYAAAQKTGLFQKLLGQGALIDQAALRPVIDGRRAILQDRQLKEWDFANKDRDQKEAPFLSAIDAAIAKRDFQGANALLDAGDYRNEALRYQGIQNGQRAVTTEKQADTRFGFDEEAEKRKVAAEAQLALTRPFEIQKIQSDLATQEQQRASSRASTELAREQLLNVRTNREKAERDAATLVQTNRLKAALDGNLYAEGVYKNGDTESLYKLMNEYNIGGTKDDSDAVDKRAKIINKLSEITKNGVNITYVDKLGDEQTEKIDAIPLGAVKAALLASQDQTFSWNGGWAATFENNLKRALSATYEKPERDAEGNVKMHSSGKPRTVIGSKAVDDLINFREIMRASAELPTVGGTAAKKPR